MSELEFRFPSEQPYAYFAVKGTPEELAAMDFELLAGLYLNTQAAVLRGTIAAKEAILGGASGRAPERPVEELPTNESQTDAEAAESLSEGLGGATQIDDVNAPPYKQPAKAAKAKPWDKPKPATEVSTDDFDF